MTREAPGPVTAQPDDFAQERVEARQQLLAAQRGAPLEHLTRASFPAGLARGNIERFIGVAQVPIGLAGPLRVRGEHASGDFYGPLATTEGALVASHGRGMKVLSLAGGVQTTITDDRMQRAPVLLFPGAREARDALTWIRAHEHELRALAESTTRIGKLIEIEAVQSTRFVFLRFHFTCGEAAGQNMVSLATRAACEWLRDRCPALERYYLGVGFCADKKSARMHLLKGRGKRVTAEASVPRALLAAHMRATPEEIVLAYQLTEMAALLSGSHSSAAHAPNAIAAIFLATGQDMATLAESSAAIMRAEVTAGGDLRLSLTLPSLVVASHGGGTGLPGQRECLESLGCTGPGGAHRLAEIVAAVALCGELSLSAAICADEWVGAHMRHGRKG